MAMKPLSARGADAQRVAQRFDGKPMSLSRFIGRLKAVHFSPEDVELLSGPPVLRRRFLDISVSQADGAYLRNLMDYNHVVTQRNALLRDIKLTGGGTSRSLEFWDAKLSELAEPMCGFATKICESPFARRCGVVPPTVEWRQTASIPVCNRSSRPCGALVDAESSRSLTGT